MVLVGEMSKRVSPAFGVPELTVAITVDETGVDFVTKREVDG
jgi:hypothetical protein